MVRVTAVGGCVVIITNGIPQKRLADLEAFTGSVHSNFKIEHDKIHLSKLSQIINIMRSTMGSGKPLSHAMKDPKVIHETMKEMARIDKLRKEEELYKNPKTKMLGMMLKAKRLREEKEEIEKEQKKASENPKVEGEQESSEKGPSGTEGVKYNPKRQEFAMMYVIRKI
uniref:Uncharacterized protein n=1 Tax=Strombidium rassoulzadegani TaxID=1082188 RepID=A0A7S3CN42_9SPIT|mmetsp:Transcript_17832/g.30249  ORF Transcript_17832/g.30249 Transcript_17832/m.30249 type:complete len:169 (+) Transcript_17832:492-998(+)